MIDGIMILLALLTLIATVYGVYKAVIKKDDITNKATTVGIGDSIVGDKFTGDKVAGDKFTGNKTVYESEKK